jgi:predicted phage terminase large subunit-like protein
LAIEHSVARRHLLSSNWYHSLWGDKFALSIDQNEKHQFDNDRKGQMIATSVGGSATGKGADTIIVDDPIAIQDRASDAVRKTANDWIDSTLKSRLNDPATGAIVLIMQRVHELDPSGYQLEQDKGAWEHVSIPLEAEEQTSYSFPISGRTHLRDRDSVIHSERFSAKTVSNLKKNRMDWAGLYQQHPAPIEGNLIKRSEVRYYGGIDRVTGAKDAPLPPTFDMVLISCDAAFKDLETSDYVAIAAIGLAGPNRYVLDVINDHLNLDGTENAIRRMRDQQMKLGRAVAGVIVEDKANGPAVVTHLQKEIPGVVAVNPQGGKVARMFAVAPEWQAGNWHVDRNAAWCEPFIQQITMFPAGAHDDMADMMSQAGIYLQMPVEHTDIVVIEDPIAISSDLDEFDNSL